MRIFDHLDEWIQFRKTIDPETTLGFAPTMGNLHKGHASLFLKSQQENQQTVSSLFINPTQFNNPDDFTHYPRTLDADLRLMEQSQVDFCILPNEKALYPDDYHYRIEEHCLNQTMERVCRPGHFQGILTVVMKLLNITRPTRAYFGEKDFQQALLIQGMVNAFFLNVDIKICPTVRENSGLAYSSRNNRLNKEQKALADEFAKLFHQANKPNEIIRAELEAKGIHVDYIEEHHNRRFAAVSIGDVRLIDNFLLET